jgi:hypothetical protein
MKKLSDIQPLHEMDLDGYTLRVEKKELGISIVDNSTGKTICWLNGIGTAVLKQWLQDFDPKDRWLAHPSVQELLEEQ